MTTTSQNLLSQKDLTHNKITYFGLMRHAPTEWNKAKRIQGHADSPLTEEGKNQAKSWAEHLYTIPWDRMLISDLGRTRETATILNTTFQVSINTDEMLREQDWGAWTGTTIAQLKIKSQEKLTNMEMAGWKFCPPDGESRNAVWKRSSQAIKTAADRWPGETILTICHEGVIKCLLYRLSSRQFLPSELPLLRPGHLHLIACENNELRIEKINAIAL
jgi:broad specificity phosphatase PhoE